MKQTNAADSLNYDHDTTMSEAISRLRQEAEEAKSAWKPRVKDITEDFTSASNQLEPGQLVKDEWFTLFEAVGALEVCNQLLALRSTCR